MYTEIPYQPNKCRVARTQPISQLTASKMGHSTSNTESKEKALLN